MKVFLQVLLGICLSIFIICAATTVTLNFIPLYEKDVKDYKLSEYTGLSEEEILKNYRVLIEYNDLGGPDQLQFPSLAMSETGRIHFTEVKEIFTGMQIAMIVCGILSAVGIILATWKKQILYRLFAGIITLALPIIVGVYAACAWDSLFVTFHKLVFNNDYWIFDPAEDPIIDLLPDGFFMHCAVMIVVIAISAAAAFLIWYACSYRRRRKIAEN